MKLIGVVGLLLTVTSAVFLYLGSTPIPGSLNIVGGGKTDQEIKSAELTRHRERTIGFVFMTIGALAQLLVLIRPEWLARAVDTTAVRGTEEGGCVMAARPSYWEIVAAYLEEGYRAWQAREDASGKLVEDGLGLSPYEGLDWHRELEGLGLVKMEETFNATVAYRLAPHGLEVAERLPEIERLIAKQWATIDASSGPAAEKERAKFSLKAELLKVGVQKGADIAIAHAPEALQQLQVLFSWLKS